MKLFIRLEWKIILLYINNFADYFMFPSIYNRGLAITIFTLIQSISKYIISINKIFQIRMHKKRLLINK
jgi:hypothetical protein